MPNLMMLSVMIGIPGLIFMGIGRLARWRSLLLRVMVVVAAVFVAVWFVAMINSMGFGVYAFYAFDRATVCETEILGTTECAERIESGRAGFPELYQKMMFWSLVPEILRPPCTETTREICIIPSFTLTSFGGWEATIIGLTTMSAAMVGVRRQKKKKHDQEQPENDKPKNVEDVSSE